MALGSCSGNQYSCADKPTESRDQKAMAAMARRRYQHPTVKRIGSGSGEQWQIRYREDVLNGSGRRVRVARKKIFDGKMTRAMAQREADDFLRKGANNANFQPLSTITFSDFIETKYRTKAFGIRKMGGQVTANSHLGHYLIPQLGALPLAAISGEAVQGMVSGMIANGLKVSSVRGVVGTLSGVMKYARRWGYPVNFNRDDIDIPKAAKSTKVKFYTPEESLAIIDEAGEFYGLIFLTQLAFALRPGEVLALRVEDLSFEDEMVHVEHSSGSAYKGQLTSTKGGNPEHKRLSPLAAGRLREYLRTSWKANPLGLLFPGERDGNVIAQSFLRENILYPVLERLKFPRDGRSLHAFRHTAASVMGQSGASPAVVGSVLRHQDGGALASKTYIHPLGTDEVDAMDKLAATFCGSPRKKGPGSCVEVVSAKSASGSAA